MSDRTGIEWTDATWQPITGCAIVSPGCTNCYAMKLAGTRLRNLPSRVGLTVPTKAGPVWNGKVRLNEEWLTQPLTWRRPRKIFVCAHGDLFAEGVPDAWIDRVFAVMALAPQHTFQVLTRRSDRMRSYLAGCTEPPSDLPLREMWVTQWHRRHGVATAMHEVAGQHFRDRLGKVRQLPLPNVWLGVSSEDQRRADERVPDLLATPAAVRFVSAEPLLGPIDFHDYFVRAQNGFGERLDWVIVGGESGPGARPMHPDWARQIRDACATAGVAFLHKQNGAWADMRTAGIVQDGPLTTSTGHVPDWMARSVTFADGTKARLRGHTFTGHGIDLVYRVGKKAAGRLLDGVEHNGMPEVRAA